MGRADGIKGPTKTQRNRPPCNAPCLWDEWVWCVRDAWSMGLFGACRARRWVAGADRRRRSHPDQGGPCAVLWWMGML